MIFPERKNTCWIAGSTLMGSYPRSDTKITQFLLAHFLLRNLNFHLAMELTNLKFEFQISVAIWALVFFSFTCRLEFQANHLAKFPFFEGYSLFQYFTCWKKVDCVGWNGLASVTDIFELCEKSGCCVSNLFRKKSIFHHQHRIITSKMKEIQIQI